ncbi:MFS transporter [Actinoplanes sp. RD1]|uniref:MFS transporter n=1 Tax=Actinoplanes sp. RD1 TaxID=3064538 RepID=UPI002741B7CB|nr:MFS transporter [Actinoplanes sp. RD1]
MPLLPTLGRTVGTSIKALRILVRGGVLGSVWATRRVGSARARGAANETGMIRLFDLHAISCAGDTLIAIGLAGTIFFDVPLGEARSKVALYLLITMVPFALLAPVVGPLLDHFRHGRRYALAVTMLGRAFLAYVIANNLLDWGLYPAAFGVLALSRAYGVARSAAVPRLLPEGVGLSQVGARASVYGTFAGAVVAPIGLLAFEFGPQWPLRVAALIFLVGVVIALRLPPRADSDPPEAVPRPFRTMLRLPRGEDRPLSGSLVINTLIGSASFRFLYGFLLLYLAFAVKGQGLSSTFFGYDIGSQGAVALVGAALAGGTFLATAAGTRLRIRRPAALQSGGLTLTAAVAVLTAIFFSLPMVALFSLVASIFSGISKLAVDASIQERVPECLRASAFAHSETVLMVAWVLGGAIGIIPLDGRLGIIIAATFATAAAVRGALIAGRLHKERLHGRPDATPDNPIPTSPAPAGGATSPAGTTPPGPHHPEPGTHPPTPPAADTMINPTDQASPARRTTPDVATPPQPARKRRLFSRTNSEDTRRQPSPPAAPGTAPQAGPPTPHADPRPGTPTPHAGPQPGTPTPQAGSQPGTPAPHAGSTAPPGFHIYRPTSATSTDVTGTSRGTDNQAPGDNPDEAPQ